MKPYDCVVSLGAACQVAEQCRRHLPETYGVPFDWTVTPFSAIEAVLRDMGSRLGHRFVVTRGGQTTLCANYGLLYEHEFARDEEGNIIFDAASVTACRDRMIHKMQKLVALLESSQRALFIRAYSSTGMPGDRFNHETFTSEDLNRLVTLIESKAPKLDFTLLFIRSDDRATEYIDLTEPLSPRVHVRQMSHPADMGWDGIDEEWKELFRDYDLTISPSSANDSGVDPGHQPPQMTAPSGVTMHKLRALFDKNRRVIR